MRLVERPDPAPDELPRAADTVMVVERALDDKGLLDLGMLVHRQCRARLPFEETRHLALRLVFVEHLDRYPVELRRRPGNLLRLHIDRASDRGFRRARPGLR